jgi:aldehyde oxidoreductase
MLGFPITVIHPQNLTGQLEGGIDMGVGWALREEYIAGKTKGWVTRKNEIETAIDAMTAIVHAA